MDRATLSTQGRRGGAGQWALIRLPAASAAHELENAISIFLSDLDQGDRSPHTVRAYRSDLGAFAAYHGGTLAAITPEVLRAYFATLADLAPSTRARKQAALATFLGWCLEQSLIDSDPMGKVKRVGLETIRRRLGHRNMQTTLRYAEQSDAISDAELRAWRRRKQGP
jgi:site-specific recombinase XerD